MTTIWSHNPAIMFLGLNIALSKLAVLRHVRTIILIIIIHSTSIIRSALSLDCYQCASETEWECGEGDLVKEALTAYNCSHVFEAQYCVKTVGKFGGGIGTKRFCSKAHMGNYCDYVKQPGDKLNYRTCIYTCTGDGCNPASNFTPMTLLAPASLLICWFVNSRR
ncbi:UPAR/Ly6 domain-containing protein bou [Prorops nasuta]|uniref:UPAR/Ly6 domain-containing protein bou n=1 Tax=Prorops nasuta TaxID=863751 RepID=UPI0034CFEE6D